MAELLIDPHQLNNPLKFLLIQRFSKKYIIPDGIMLQKGRLWQIPNFSSIPHLPL